jgi:patatin-like phospholipase/acyl hydrolase
MSLDAAGVRGIMTLTVLNYLERRIQDIQGDNRIRLGNFVDFAAGTATGSTILSFMFLPSGNKSPWAKLNLNEISKIYLELVDAFFHNNLKHKLKSLWGLRGPLLPVSKADELFLKHLSHYKMSDLIKPLVITGYDITKREIILYSNFRDEKYKDYYIKDVMKAALSTPGTMEPGYFKEGTDENVIIQGGLFAGNPSMIALTEAHNEKIIDSGKLEDVFFLSFGGGKDHKLKKKYSYEKAKRWCSSEWLFPILDIVQSASQEATEKQIRSLFQSQGCLENYHRIDPPVVLGNGQSMDPDKDNLMNVIKDATNYIEENKVYLEDLANKMCRLRYLIRVDDD